MPGTANLAIYQGDDYAADILVFEADGTTPADLTGYTAQAEIRTQAGDSCANAAAIFTVTIVLPNTITIQLSHDQTKALTKATYVWDVQCINADGWITTLLAGQVMVTKEVTHVYGASR